MRVKENEETGLYFNQEQNKSPESDLNEMEISDLPNRDFKIIVIKMLTESKTAMQEQRISTKRKYKNTITKLKTTTTKISVEEYNSRPDQAEERISKLEGRPVRFIQSEKEKRIKRIKIPQGLMGHHKWTNMCIISVPEGKERKRGRRLIQRSNG